MEEILNDSGKLMFCVMIFVMITETIAGLFFLMRAKSFMANAVTTMATVTAAKAYGSSNGGTHYQLDLVYKDGMGNEHTGRISQGKEAKEGEQVEILYDQNNPEKARANNKMQIFIVPYAMMGSIMPLGAMLAMMVEQGIAKLPF